MKKIDSNLYKSLLENFPIALVITDLKGTLLDVSKSTLELYGTTKKSEVIGKSAFKFVHEEDQEKARSYFEDILQNKNIGSVIYKLLRKDGSVFDAKIFSEIITENGAPKFFILTFRNISREIRLENELRKSKERFQLVLDNIPQFIFWKDIESVYQGCNKNFARVAGVKKPENIIGKTDFDLAWKKEQAESFYEIDRLVMESDKPEYHIIESQQQADGKQAWLDENKIPLHNESAEVVGLLGTYEDITDRIEAENALKESEQKYKEAYQNVNFYRDLFSHDINNILQGIQSANDVLKILIDTTMKREDLKNVSNIIGNQVMRGAKLVHNIRKLSEIEERIENIRKLEILSRIKKRIQKVKRNFILKRVKTEINAFSDEIYIKANGLISDVIENLLINAITYNNNDVVEIMIKVSEAQEQETRYVKIEIIDNGIGIEDVRKEKIFTRTEIEAESLSGLGLGLSLVRKIIDAYGGKVWVEDRVKGEPSKGSNFILIIPAF